jgi:hypothetical protein
MPLEIPWPPGQKTPRRPRDRAQCRTGPADGPLIPCLMPEAADCEFAGFLNRDAYCLHPDRKSPTAKS